MALRDLEQKVKHLRTAFQIEDTIALKESSEACLQRAAMVNDRGYANLALIGYSLNKLVSKRHIVIDHQWTAIKAKILRELDLAAYSLARGKPKEFGKSLDTIIEVVSEVDHEFGRYAISMEEKARLKMASAAYGLGLSLSQAVDLTGAEKEDVQNYIGWTRMHDEEGITFGIAARLKPLREMFE
ncbi:MAG TPA: hypothetical protein HA252_00665 [Candidatus Diapherotrites archaeon]|uniref:Uncharacterized protein n=1 Tax=Candidatus Iainarchaeum sp. TaxID=3101447 RepID=A0A7J4JDR4_9ARCH|nr:hypothetical protein [Candidatus Diapherotrites archaeon]HIH15901.1 hypothetical protein [Candidatus Diapherotrites archaeon]